MALVSYVLGDCPRCGQNKTFGNIDVYETIVSLGCKKCSYKEIRLLPSVEKKVLYLDQFFFSHAVRGNEPNFVAAAEVTHHIGASKALVKLTISPLLKLRAPYIVMAGAWILGMCLGLAINSASGLAMLLMVTIFPILINLGVSRLAATAVIATTLCLDWSPSDTGTLLAANTAGIDPVLYWVKYQVPIAAVTIPVVAVLHYLTQKWMDARDGHVVKAAEIAAPTAGGRRNRPEIRLSSAAMGLEPAAISTSRADRPRDRACR